MRRNVIFAFMFLSIFVFKANAAQIQARNVSFNGVDYDEFRKTQMITGEAFNERFLTAEDDSYTVDPRSVLDAYTKEPNDANQISTNRKRFNTPGWFIYLGANQFVPGPMSNDIEIVIDNANGLEHRKVITYDVNNPNTVYDVPKNGTLFWEPLPPITNQPAGEYATWKIETPALVLGDIAGPNGIGELDGTVDAYDLKVIADEWLNETLVGENYNCSDVDYDRLTNFVDFSIIAGSWLKEEE
jgi:hypothetical protein